jgi:hypothetical protein
MSTLSPRRLGSLASIALLSAAASGQGTPTKIIPGDVGSFDRFGTSVATAGSYLFSGSPSHQGKGAVYVYANEAGAWTFKQKVQPTDLQTGDEFGNAVAVSRNLVVVGAPNAGQLAGAVYVFRATATGLVQEAKIVLAGSAKFGASVDIWDDRLIVGERERAAHVYRRVAPGDWGSGPEDTLLPPPSDAIQEYGESVALYQGLALVGDGQYDDLLSTKPGAVYPFFLSGTDWVPGDRIDNPGPKDDAPHFGFTVDVYGLFAVIGAYNDSVPGPGQGSVFAAGSAYVFQLQQGAWVDTGQTSLRRFHRRPNGLETLSAWTPEGW